MRKRHFLSTVHFKNDHFYQDRLGTNIGKAALKKVPRFTYSGEAGSAYDRQYVCRMALFDSASGKLDAGGWTDITLKIGESETRNATRSLCVLDVDSTAFGTS
eukprot:COSAG06_NODE_606_length_13867_cov_16.158701_3_plen_103_part_00